ncbi:MAG: rhomboid family intramembrane serine protease [Bacteroidales bacterium]|nr:rhomboid family intramembrane serine protease [Bacteroidales bacterium]
MSLVTIIGILTIIISLLGFRNKELFSKFKLNPYLVVHKKDYHRVITHAFLHADWIHLIINVMVFFSFGESLQLYFNYYFGKSGALVFLGLYIGGIIFSSLYSIAKHKNDSYYNAIGASGAVSAVVFASIFFDPWHKIGLFAVLPIPGIIFAFLYLAYSYYMGKKGYDNIGHDAHFFGAVFGLMYPVLIKHDLFFVFIHQLSAF